MSLTTYKNSFLSHNTLLTYHEKLKNELESIPKLHKKFFMNSLAKHKFDSDVYIPMENERNRKVYPDKDYLINKIIFHDNIVNKNKKKIDIMSKNFSKFFKFYNYLKNTNTKQRDYMSNLVAIYKNKYNTHNAEDIEYNHNENIFNDSILLECNNNQGVKKYELNDKKILKHDKNILLNFESVINKTCSPNSKTNKPQNYDENFLTSINQSYFINNNKEEENESTKKEMRETRTEINLEKNESKRNIKISTDRKFDPKNSAKKNAAGSNNKEKNNTLDNYLLNSRLLKINKISRNKINKEFKSNKGHINTIYSKDNNITKNALKTQNTQNISKLNNIFLNKYNKGEINNKFNNNIKTYRAINIIKTNLNKDNKEKRTKFKFNISEDRNNSKYLLTTLNKLNITNKIEDLSEIKNNKEKAKSISRNNFEKNKNINSTMRAKLNMNLPGIIQSYQNVSKSIANAKIKENQNQSKYINEQKHKTMIKKENIDYYDYKKAKEEEINKLYSTLVTKSNYFREYPYNKIKAYFKKYTNIIVNKIETEKGSNIFPLLDNIENIGKNKGISKLAKSLDETKQYFILRNTKKNSENLEEEKSVNILDKIIDKEKKFPEIKYDSAEKIIFDEKGVNKE